MKTIHFFKNRSNTARCISISVLVFACVMLFSGCRLVLPQSASKKQPIPEIGAYLSEPILMIPAVSEKASTEARTHFAKAMRLAAKNEALSQVVNGGEVSDLEGKLTRHNLFSNGQVAISEFAAAGKTVGCSSAMLPNILRSETFPPQRLVVEIYWVDCVKESIIRHKRFDVTTADEDDKKAYMRSLGISSMDIFKQKLTDVEDRKHTAMLSPNRFRRFVAEHILKQMIYKADQQQEAFSTDF